MKWCIGRVLGLFLSVVSRERGVVGCGGLLLRPSFCVPVAASPPSMIWFCRSVRVSVFGCVGLRVGCHCVIISMRSIYEVSVWTPSGPTAMALAAQGSRGRGGGSRWSSGLVFR